MERFPGWRRLWTPWVVVLIFTLIYLGITLIQHAGDTVDAFVITGSCYSSCRFDPDIGCPKGEDIGYDGQFAYYIARDPLHAAPCIDVPAYRYQRILLPALGRLLALGQVDLIPAAFVVINVTALVIGTALLERLLVELAVSRWYALVYGLFFGVVAGVRASTAEPLAYSLVIVAIWLHGRGNRWLTALALLAAMMAKETTGLFVAGFGLYFVLHARWKEVLRLGVVVGVPFVAWQIALWDWLGELPAGSGGRDRTGFEIIPFNGVWRIFTESGDLALMVVLGAVIVPAVILPTLWDLRATLREFRAQRGKVHLYTCLCAANAGIMLFVPYSTYTQLLGILRFMVGLVLGHLLYAALRAPGRRPLSYSVLWIMLTLFTLAG